MNECISTQLETVRSSIRQYESAHGRTTDSVALLAVSKTKPISAIQAAIAAGQRCFGENYVDEAIDKIQQLGHRAPDDSALSWHFIGAIQSRKTRDIARHFDWAHGVDRLKVAQRLSQARTETDLPPLNICLQVALDDESTKAGVQEPSLEALAHEVAELPGLRLRGLMAIPAPRKELAEQRAVFARLSAHLGVLAAHYPSMDTLSCGMSGDLEAAIAEGATIVRIGTAIFGARDARSKTTS